LTVQTVSITGTDSDLVHVSREIAAPFQRLHGNPPITRVNNMNFNGLCLWRPEQKVARTLGYPDGTERSIKLHGYNILALD
jgi:hypothetical protein